MIRHHRRAHEGERGQALVVVALTLVVLLLMAAVAMDMGRFVTDRRFLQNATDAAALAGAMEWKQANARGEDAASAAADAKARALEVLHQHYGTDPTATRPPDPAVPPVYDPACSPAGAPACLVDGIIVNPPQEPGTVRVAIRNPVDFTFGQVASLIGGTLDFQIISARSRAGRDPNAVGPLPVTARQWVAPYGPRNPTTSPCTYDSQHPEFTSVFSTAATSCLGSVTAPSGRIDASVLAPGMPVELLGQGADPCSSPECGNNPVSFGGFVALDIRNFSNSTSQVFYNGVTSGTTPNTLKQMEAAYFCSGYPGPAFAPITSPPDPRDQVAALDGASAGIAISGTGTGTGLASCYGAGDLLFVLVYDGIINQVPQFDMQWPGSNKLGRIDLSPIGTNLNPGTFSITKNPALSGTVSLETLPVDPVRDPDNPLVDGTIAAVPPLSYSPNPATPTGGNGTAVSIGSGSPFLNSITTGPTLAKPGGATVGIYAAIVKGTANSYTNVVHYLPLSINVGGVKRDFSISGPTPQGCNVAVNSGDQISCDFSVSNVSNSNRFGASVALTLEQLDGTVVQTLGGVTPNGTVSMSLSTSGMAQGLYTFVVRGTGINSDLQSVTHLYPFSITVAPQSAPGSDTYVDITGYAVMKICNPFSASQQPVTAGAACLEPSRGWDPNSVWAEAITPVLTSPDDAAFDIIQPIRLIPWGYPTQ